MKLKVNSKKKRNNNKDTVFVDLIKRLPGYLLSKRPLKSV